MGLFSRQSSQDADNVALAAARARLSSDDVDQVRFLITTKKTVHAVKLIRDRTGLDLKHAKGLVDDIRLGRYVAPVTDTPARPPARHEPGRAHPRPQGRRANSTRRPRWSSPRPA